MVLNKVKILNSFLLFLGIFIVFEGYSINDFQTLYDSAKKHRSIDVAMLSLEAAKETKDNTLIAKAYFLIGFYQRHQHMYYQSLNSYFMAEEYYRKSRNINRLVDVSASIGVIYTKGGFTTQAINFFQDGIALAKQTNDKGQELHLQQQVARAYRLSGEYEMAKSKYIELIPKFQAQGNNNMVSQCYLGLGYIETKSRKNYDSANYYYTQAVSWLESNERNQRLTLLKKTNSLAYMQIEGGALDTAKRLLVSAIEQTQTTTNNRPVLIDIYSNLGDAYSRSNMKDSASYFYEKAIALESLREFSKGYLQRAKYLYDYYKTSNSKKALEYHNVIFQFADQLAGFKQNLQEASHRYQIAAANYKRETELIYAQQQDRMILNTILFISLAVIMLIGLMYYLYERRKRVTKWRRVLNELTIKPGITSYP